MCFCLDKILNKPASFYWATITGYLTEGNFQGQFPSTSNSPTHLIRDDLAPQLKLILAFELTKWWLVAANEATK
jgi:hypothetical protein